MRLLAQISLLLVAGETNMWITGRDFSGSQIGWMLIAISDSKEGALAACVDSRDFIAEYELNEVYPDTYEDNPSADAQYTPISYYE